MFKSSLSLCVCVCVSPEVGQGSGEVLAEIVKSIGSAWLIVLGGKTSPERQIFHQ